MICNQCGNEILLLRDYYDAHNCIHCVRKNRNKYMKEYNKTEKQKEYINEYMKEYRRSELRTSDRDWET